ncbi:hypothetical protein [Streptococcus suis]
MKCFLSYLTLNLEGLIDMVKKYTYDWPEAEDDNIDFNAIRERNKDKTIADLDAEWDEFVKNLKLETI